jgi:hypothetical protein
VTCRFRTRRGRRAGRQPIPRQGGPPTHGVEQVAAGLLAAAAGSAQTRQCLCMPACRSHSSPQLRQAVAQAWSCARVRLASYSVWRLTTRRVAPYRRQRSPGSGGCTGQLGHHLLGQAVVGAGRAGLGAVRQGVDGRRARRHQRGSRAGRCPAAAWRSSWQGPSFSSGRPTRIAGSRPDSPDAPTPLGLDWDPASCCRPDPRRGGQDPARPKRRRRSELPTTLTLDRAMAAPATIGLSSPRAASGIAATL